MPRRRDGRRGRVSQRANDVAGGVDTPVAAWQPVVEVVSRVRVVRATLAASPAADDSKRVG